MKYLQLFSGRAIISRIDTYTYFDWVFNCYYRGEKEEQEFVFAKDYQIENVCLEELIKRDLILKIEKKEPLNKNFFIKSGFDKMQKFIEHIGHYPNGNKARPRDDLFLQLNVKLFRKEYVLFDFVFFGYKYILRDIQMPMELYNEFADRAKPRIRFMKEYKVFIAHASEDKELARKIAQDITKKGYQVWFDEWEIKVGDSIVNKINQGINETAYMIVLFSTNSVNKPWVKRELNAGVMQEFETKRVYLLPALIESCKIPPLISDKYYADFTKSYDAGLDEILNAL